MWYPTALIRTCILSRKMIPCIYGISKQHLGYIYSRQWTYDMLHYTVLLVLEHMYECRAPDEEAEDLICTACYPDGDNGHYNCSCWVSSQPEPLEEVYLTCQDALDKGETESGVYKLKPDHLPAFQVWWLSTSFIASHWLVKYRNRLLFWQEWTCSTVHSLITGKQTSV